jgi:hypothetical protein
MSVNTTNSELRKVLESLSPLKAGDTIKRGDVFKDADGEIHEINARGQILGVSLIGEEVAKAGYWFRPSYS